MPLPVTNCPACRSARSRLAFGSRSTFLRCRGCATVYDAEPLGPAEVERLYEGREYFVKVEGDPGAVGDALWGYPEDYLADRAFIDAKFDRVLGHLRRYVPPGRLLDVGAGPGFLVSRAAALGWEAAGVDLNAWAAGYARTELGVDVRHGRLSDDLFGDEPFDAITMMDVVEHVVDPDELLEEASRRTRAGGAIALLTPDAAAPLSRLLGQRWPEVRRPGEHVVLFSVAGLSQALARHGFTASGWHSIGKVAPVTTLLADVAPAAPALTNRLQQVIGSRPVGQKVVELDPRTKFVLYARRLPSTGRPSSHRPARVPRQPEELHDVDQAILDELGSLAAAERLCAWMFDSFAEHVSGATVLEVGAGIGTFSARMLEAGAEALLLVEPEAACAEAIEARFAGEPRVTTSRDPLPGAPCLAGATGRFDLVVCQNVLEHIADDRGALLEMADVLRSGGHLALLVPAEPWLFGALDDAYGHWRRYRRQELADLVRDVGLEVQAIRPMNALGIAGWWAKNRRPGARIGAGSLSAYETLVRAWRPLEGLVRPGLGLSLVCTARKPAAR